jgi:hypothetical protein
LACGAAGGIFGIPTLDGGGFEAAEIYAAELDDFVGCVFKCGAVDVDAEGGGVDEDDDGALAGAAWAGAIQNVG